MLVCFQTSIRYVDIFQTSTSYVIMFFWTSTEYVEIFFKHALDMSAFFLLKSSRYVGIFSDENYLCRHFFKRALDIFEFFRNALDMSTCFQKNTRYVDISLDKHLIFRSNLQKFLISARGHFSLHNTYLR